MNPNIRILHTNKSDFRIWRNYYSELPLKGIYHSPEYIRVLETHYQNQAELFLFEDQENFIYYPYFKRRLDKLPFSDKCDFDLSMYSDIVSSWYYGGPLLKDINKRRSSKTISDFLKAFKEYCREQKIVSEFIRYDPNIKNHVFLERLIDVRANRKTVYIDLCQNLDLIWNNMEGRCRTAIRKAINSGIIILESESLTDFEEFHKIYLNEMDRKKAPQHYYFEFEFFQNLLNELKGKAKLFIAKRKGVFLGSSLCLYESAGTAHDYLMACKPEFWKFQPNNLILYESLLWCKRMGLKFYDFQGGREGVYRFKKSFSKMSNIFYTSSVIHNSKIYSKLTNLKNTLSGNISTFFPAYRTNDTN